MIRIAIVLLITISSVTTYGRVCTGERGHYREGSHREYRYCKEVNTLIINHPTMWACQSDARKQIETKKVRVSSIPNEIATIDSDVNRIKGTTKDIEFNIKLRQDRLSFYKNATIENNSYIEDLGGHIARIEKSINTYTQNKDALINSLYFIGDELLTYIVDHDENVNFVNEIIDGQDSLSSGSKILCRNVVGELYLLKNYAEKRFPEEPLKDAILQIMEDIERGENISVLNIASNTSIYLLNSILKSRAILSDTQVFFDQIIANDIQTKKNLEYFQRIFIRKNSNHDEAIRTINLEIDTLKQDKITQSNTISSHEKNKSVLNSELSKLNQHIKDLQNMVASGCHEKNSWCEWRTQCGPWIREPRPSRPGGFDP